MRHFLSFPIFSLFTNSSFLWHLRNRYPHLHLTLYATLNERGWLGCSKFGWNRINLKLGAIKHTNRVQTKKKETRRHRHPIRSQRPPNQVPLGFFIAPPRSGSRAHCCTPLDCTDKITAVISGTCAGSRALMLLLVPRRSDQLTRCRCCCNKTDRKNKTKTKKQKTKNTHKNKTKQERNNGRSNNMINLSPSLHPTSTVTLHRAYHLRHS